MKMSKKLIYMCATVLTAVLSVGCSQSESVDDPDNPGFKDGIPTEVRITISARPNNGTRADDKDGDPKDPVASVELIHDWWIAFVNDKNKTVKVVTREQAEDKTSSTSVDIPGGGFEAETFRTTLPSGTYRVYAFANIDYKTEDEMKGTDGKAGLLSENSKKTEYKLIDKYIYHFVPNAFKEVEDSPNKDMQWFDEIIKNGKSVDNNIPMTGTFTQVVNNTVEATLNFEVVRAVAKIEFSFTNPSSDEITLKELKFGPISHGDNISIVPNYSAIGKGSNRIKLDEDIKTDKGTLTFPNLNSLVKKTGTDPEDLGSFCFYCKESVPDETGDNAGYFAIDLKVDKKTSSDSETVTLTKKLFTKKITYINRNDWIKIPISFTDWIIRWRMHYYPPIGGYPPLFEQSNDGTDVYLTATTPGEFEIFPDITYSGKDGRIDYNWVQGVKNTWNHVPNEEDPIEYVSINVTAGKNLFIKEPTKQTDMASIGDKQRYYFSGEFNNVEGTATVVVTFKLLDGPYKGEIKTCTFHITRQNGGYTGS